MTEHFSRLNYICGESDANKQPHHHNNRCFPFIVVVHVNQGEYICYHENKTLVTKEGETLIVPEYVLHDIAMKATGNLSWAHITATINNEAVLSGAKEPFVLRNIVNSDIKHLVDSLNRLNAGSIPLHVLNEQVLIAKLFILVLQSHKSAVVTDAKWVTDIKKYITQNITESFTLKDLAAQCCMSESSFCHKFKSEVGISPIKYTILQKINESLPMLSAHLPLKTISQRLNFSNEYYYSAKFKQVTGMTPSEYIKRKNLL